MLKLRMHVVNELQTYIPSAMFCRTPYWHALIRTSYMAHGKNIITNVLPSSSNIVIQSRFCPFLDSWNSMVADDSWLTLLFYTVISTQYLKFGEVVRIQQSKMAAQCNEKRFHSPRHFLDEPFLSYPESRRSITILSFLFLNSITCTDHVTQLITQHTFKHFLFKHFFELVWSWSVFVV